MSALHTAAGESLKTRTSREFKVRVTPGKSGEIIKKQSRAMWRAAIELMTETCQPLTHDRNVSAINS